MIHIGTSGWNYPHWNGIFYPPKMTAHEQLAFYARHFHTVEINRSFYRLPEREQFAAWADVTAEISGFVYAVKASRYLTHMRKLREPAEALTRLLDAAGGLDGQLGPLLFQLPPRWRANPDRFRAFLDQLPPRHRYAFEFRDATWYAPDILAALEEHGCALAVAVGGQLYTPVELRVPGPFGYIRFHNGLYGTGFTDGELAFWAERIASESTRHDLYVYFNNDPDGHAIADARRLREMLAGRGAPLQP